MFKKLLLITAAAIGGIYLTSEEGKQARAALMKKKATFEPIVKDLMKQVNEVLEGSKQINSDEIRANVNLLVKEAKATLVEIDLEKTTEAIREAIKVASKKIREAADEVDKSEEVKVTQTIKKPVVAKAKKPAAKNEVVKKAPAKKPAPKAKIVKAK